VQPTYRYATIPQIKSRLSDDVITDGNITDSEILARIQAASAMINEWTRQVFQPTPETIRESASGDKLFMHPSRLPFLQVKSLYIDPDRTTGEFKGMERIIPDPAVNTCSNLAIMNSLTFRYQTDYLDINGDGQKVAWEPGKRFMKLIALCGGITKGVFNVQVEGWWGWLESLKLVTVSLGTEIPANDDTVVTVHLNSAVDPNTGDFIQVGDTIAIATKMPTGALIPSSVELAVVQAIADNVVSGVDITVDPLNPYPVALPVNTPVYCFGRTPNSLAEVCQYLAAELVKQLSADRTGDVFASQIADGATLKSEKTDNYSYTLGEAGGGGGGGTGGLGKFTGSVRMDLVLRQYAQPTVAMRYF